MGAFAHRAIALAAQDRRRMAGANGWVFFDRGLVDAAVALQHATGRAEQEVLAPYDRYHRRVFLTRPWPGIYGSDEERQHDLAEAVAEYDRLVAAYRELGYETFVLPKVAVADRADFILECLD